MQAASTQPSLYGLMAEFKEPEQILRAANSVREAGYKRIDAYTPFPVHGLDEAVGADDIWVPWVIFLSGLGGGLFGYWLQWWINVVDYPMNVGGRPQASWPTFIVPSYELTILFASLAAAIGMMVIQKLVVPSWAAGGPSTVSR